ncbi:hypothetical protein PR003_g32274 [Phytophthora rubi]|uniref:Secreted protein n=1 Tax=Phytophthora rubi TaxID=129364 RepID=A0A6A4B3J3_9STRA|nr:hypothetical protein PR001_g28601 [Phytophthora rubi]KAE9266002.1 hypothetical protein PR003_g32274 [Phytophthora rubi]
MYPTLVRMTIFYWLWRAYSTFKTCCLTIPFSAATVSTSSVNHQFLVRVALPNAYGGRNRPVPN